LAAIRLTLALLAAFSEEGSLLRTERVTSSRLKAPNCKAAVDDEDQNSDLPTRHLLLDEIGNGSHGDGYAEGDSARSLWVIDKMAGLR
jgi:hypothetical protein